MVEVADIKTCSTVGVPQGFKETEVGLIPEDWEAKSIDEFCELTSSKRIFEGEYVPFGVPFYRGKEISLLLENKPITDPYYISEEKFLSLKRTFGAPVKNDILITAVGTLGNVYLIPSNTDFYFKDGNLIWLRKIKGIDPKFLSIQIANFRKEIIDNAIGSSQKALTIVVLRKQHIPFPPTKAEQTAIATALSDMDALIEAKEKLIAKKRAIKQGAMQELLRPKEGWVEKKLGEVASLKARIGWQGLTTAEYRSSGEYFLITGTDFKNGLIDWENCHYVELERYTQDKNIQVRENDVLVTKDGTIGKVAFIRFVPKPATLNSGVFVIRPRDENFDSEFFYHLLLSNVFSIFLSQLSAGSTINHLYQKDFVHFNFEVPRVIEKQREIARILSGMDQEIEQLEVQLSKYKLLKTGMMQDLLTGKKRLV